MKGCGYCKDQKNKFKHFLEEIEREKIIECERAIEKEKIDRGMKFTKNDEMQVREQQKLQMLEKKYVERELKEINSFWHHVLLEDVRDKEQKELKEAERLKQEMHERRMAYDEQISSANKKRRELLVNEREMENKRLTAIKERMEKEYYDAFNRKKAQQTNNRNNYIKGHEMKLNMIRNEKRQERELDMKAIQRSTEELRKERRKKLEQMRQLQMEKLVFAEHLNAEKEMAERLKREEDSVINEWMQGEEQRNKEHTNKTEQEIRKKRMNAVLEYQKYIDNRNLEVTKQKQERIEKMEGVKRTAYRELQKSLDLANEEMRKQIEYRTSLAKQVNENQKMLELELTSIEQKQMPFTKKPNKFADIMRDKYNSSTQRENTVHPFYKIIKSQVGNNSKLLPALEKKNYF